MIVMCCQEPLLNKLSMVCSAGMFLQETASGSMGCMQLC